MGLWWACVGPIVGLWWAYGGFVVGLCLAYGGMRWACGGPMVGLCWAYGGMGMVCIRRAVLQAYSCFDAVCARQCGVANRSAG